MSSKGSLLQLSSPTPVTQTQPLIYTQDSRWGLTHREPSHSPILILVLERDKSVTIALSTMRMSNQRESHSLPQTQP